MMMERSWLLRGLLVCLLCAVSADEVDLEVQSGLMMRMLRDMANQTAADSLNLPANASSIRENITDTFSCENRTYGYYADVDNDCQVFHVCLPSQTASGRNVTYRWSFICPKETVFNQEVLVCTRPADAIDCKDSPEYYDINKEIGKERIVENDTITNSIETDKKDNNRKEITNKVEQMPQIPSRYPNKRKPVKQNYIIQQLIKEIVEDEMRDKIQDLDPEEIEIFPVVSESETKDVIENIVPSKIVETPSLIDEREPISNRYTPMMDTDKGPMMQAGNTPMMQNDNVPMMEFNKPMTFTEMPMVDNEAMIVNRDKIVLPDPKGDFKTDYNYMRETERDGERLILERRVGRKYRARNGRGSIKFVSI